jgi:hypothetical protein
MDFKTIPTDRYFQQLRALGAWWRLGSSVVEPQLLVASIEDVALAGHGGVDLDLTS